ncbi:MAG: hypothetical protein JXQ71_08900 [Verrucomicrobia bacterium]|nr:hypothetical protein [Verrucomicrobiota bacterium]
MLACPSDPSVKEAFHWSVSPEGGFLNPAYRNNAVSYFLGLHAVPEHPQSILLGDRNLRTNGLGGCTSGITIAAQVYEPLHATGWLPAIHGLTGNLLLNDGQVRVTSSAELIRAMGDNPTHDGTHCFLFPR